MQKRFETACAAALILGACAPAADAAVPPPPLMVPPVPMDGASFVVFQIDAQLGDPASQTRVGESYQNGNFVPKDGMAAAAWYKKASDEGYALAEFHLGDMYAWGDGVAQDAAAAAGWYHKAADRGLGVAQIELGQMYLAGKGVPQDYAQAYVWFDIASAQGGNGARDRDRAAARLTPRQLSDAQAQVAAWQPTPMTDDMRCAGGHDAYNHSSYVEAARVFFPLAEAGNACAQYWLGEMYVLGHGESMNRDKALDWFKKAAAQGHAGAERMAGRMMADDANFAGVFPLWQQAADQGLATAEMDFGSSYLYGQGVARDDAKGAEWIGKAAAQGWPDGMLTLGKLYRLGRGVAADPVEAYKWQSLAVEYGRNTGIETDARGEMKMLAQTLTADQIAEAEKRAAVWRPVFPKP